MWQSLIARVVDQVPERDVVTRPIHIQDRVHDPAAGIFCRPTARLDRHHELNQCSLGIG